AVHAGALRHGACAAARTADALRGSRRHAAGGAVAAGAHRHQPGHERHRSAAGPAQPARPPRPQERLPVDPAPAAVHGEPVVDHHAGSDAFLERYRARLAAGVTPETPIDRARFIVLDSETTGLDPRTDRLVTIGAVAVQAGEIRLDDTFDALLALD